MIILLVPPSAEIVRLTVVPKCDVHPLSPAVGCYEAGIADAGVNLCLGCGIRWGTRMLMAYESPGTTIQVMREGDATRVWGGANG